MDAIIHAQEIVVDLEIAEALETVVALVASEASADGGYGLYYYSSSLDGVEMAMDLEEIDMEAHI